MADERKRVMGFLAAWQIVEFAGGFGGSRPDVNRVNPFGGRPNPVIERKIAESEKAQFWGYLRQGLMGGK
ncbi:hypothetical protein [Zavarzinella formosa]|uniref:hypothetical protein n=1 Tax=Zavarzinella formosa TaxID=360055 RepID=UPI0012F87A75|nr:hypothetical protein [Zavarzinella formosa]